MQDDDRERAAAADDALFLRSIVENIPMMVFVKEAANLRFVLFNHAGEQLLGMSREQLIGRNDFDFFPAEQAEFFTGKDREVLAGGRMLDIPEEPIDTPGGQRFLHTKKIPLLDAEGRPRFLLGISLDVTERKRAAEELQRAKLAAEAASRAKDMFLATMSHEIRTPLNGIIGMAELLRGTSVDPQQLDYVETLQLSARHLMTLIDDILDLGRIEGNELELELAPFDVRELVTSTIALFARGAQDGRLALAGVVAEAVPGRLVGDVRRLRQVLINLVNNAIKFTDAGRVQVEVDVAREEPAAVVLRFRVSDTGIGIAPDDVDRIFDSFTQVDASRSRRYAGAGLGLAICKRLCERMGGSIGVESQLGQGSTFWFTVSLSCSGAGRGDVARMEPDLAVTPGGAPASRKARILVVEDHAVNRKVAIALLARLGHDAEAVEGGAQALVALGRSRYDLVLMDCEMPGLDGFQTTQGLRACEPAGTRMPVIAMTAHSMTGDRERCLAAGMDDFISKPVGLDHLREVLDRWLPPTRSP